MKNIMLGALVIALVVGVGLALPSKHTESAKAPKPPAETVLFVDNFDGTTLDTSKWTHCFPGNNCRHDENKELQTYQPENVAVENGKLKITAVLDLDKGFTSGLIQTDQKFSYRYGRVEVRAKTPEGKGLWPTVWQLSTDHQWPPELNVLEQIGQIKDTNFMGIHYKQDDGSHGYTQQTVTSTDLTADFHTYAMEWREGVVTWFLDGREVASYHNKYKVTDKEMYLIINLAVGGTAGGNPDDNTPFPAVLEVDYIKVTK